jgi:hypothetical protein
VIVVAFPLPKVSVVPTLSKKFVVRLPKTDNVLDIVPVDACRALAEIPTVNVSKTLAVSATVLLRYKASASESVNEVELVKKSGLKSIPLKLGLGAVFVSAINYT